MGPRRRAMPTFITQGTNDTLSVPIFGAAIRNAMLHVNGLGSRDIVSAKKIAPGPDRHAVDLTTYGRRGRAVVVYANVLGGNHASGPGALTINGRALDGRVIDFLLAQSR